MVLGDAGDPWGWSRSSSSITLGSAGSTVVDWEPIHLIAEETFPCSISLTNTFSLWSAETLHFASFFWIAAPSLTSKSSWPSCHHFSLLSRYATCSLVFDFREGFWSNSAGIIIVIVKLSGLINDHESRRSRVQAPSDVVPLIFGLHYTCVFSYLSKPLKCIHVPSLLCK